MAFPAGHPTSVQGPGLSCRASGPEGAGNPWGAAGSPQEGLACPEAYAREGAGGWADARGDPGTTSTADADREVRIATSREGREAFPAAIMGVCPTGLAMAKTEGGATTIEVATADLATREGIGRGDRGVATITIITVVISAGVVFVMKAMVSEAYRKVFKGAELEASKG